MTTTVLPVRVPGLSQTVATPHNGSARKAADLQCVLKGE